MVYIIYIDFFFHCFVQLNSHFYLQPEQYVKL